MGVVEVGGMLRRHDSGVDGCCTARCIIALDSTGIVAPVDDRLFHVHVRHLENKTECILVVNIPVVTHFHHIILEINVISGTGVVLQ